MHMEKEKINTVPKRKEERISNLKFVSAVISIAGYDLLSYYISSKSHILVLRGKNVDTKASSWLFLLKLWKQIMV